MTGSYASRVTRKHVPAGKLLVSRPATVPRERLSGAHPEQLPKRNTAAPPVAETRRTATYTFEEHIANKSAHIRELVLAIREYVLNIDAVIEEAPKQNYVAYRTTQNIACVEVQQRKVTIFLKLNPKKVELVPGFVRDVTDIGHFGTGNVEVTIQSIEDFERAKPLIQQAYEAVGG
jgi:predicted transport protein